MSGAEFDRDEGDLTPDVIEHAQDYIDRCDDAFVVCFQEGDDGDLKTAYAVGLWPSHAEDGLVDVVAAAQRHAENYGIDWEDVLERADEREVEK